MGERFISKSALLVFGLIFGLLIIYLSSFEIKWYNGAVPSEVLYLGRIDYGVSDFILLLSTLFIIMFLIEVYWLSTKSSIFFNEATMMVLVANLVSSRMIWVAYTLKRIFIIICVNIFFIISVFVFFLVKDGVFLTQLLKNSYILFGASLLVIIFYDIFFFLTLKSSSASAITTLLILMLPLIDVSLRPFFEGTKISSLKLLDLTPDVISISYNYVLYSFGSAYSLSKIYYPLFFLIISLVFGYLLSKKLYQRLLNRNESFL